MNASGLKKLKKTREGFFGRLVFWRREEKPEEKEVLKNPGVKQKKKLRREKKKGDQACKG